MTRVHTSTVTPKGVGVCEPKDSFPGFQGGGLVRKNSQTLSFCLLKKIIINFESTSKYVWKEQRRLS